MDMQPFWSLGVPTVGTWSLPGVNSDFPRSKVPLYDVQTLSEYIYIVYYSLVGIQLMVEP